MELNQRIIQQFEKYPLLRVLFFFDDQKEYQEEVDGFNLSNVRVVKYANDPFNLKVKLNNEWATDKIFLYFNSAAPSNQTEYKKFPLMDLLVANKELRLGDVSEFMEQYKLPLSKQSLVSQFMQELKHNQVQDLLKPILNAGSFTEESLHKGLTSAFLKFNELQPWDILLGKIFILSKPAFSSEFKRFVKKVQENKLEDVINTRFADLLDEKHIHLSQESLADLLKKLKYNLITQYLELAKHDPYGNLKIKHGISLSRLGMFYEQVKNHPKTGTDFMDVLIEHGKEIKEETILQYYGVDANYGWLPDGLKWLILSSFIHEIPNDATKALADLEKMSLHHEENREIRSIVNASLHTATCFKLIDGIASYRLNNPEEYVKKYVTEFYKIDQSYRKSIYKLSAVDSAEIPEFVLIDKLKEELNNRYDLWLEKINREWLSCLNTKQFDYDQLGLPKQYDFYKNEVEPFDQKVVVFISDALRYEVAMELLNDMHNDSKSEAEARFMLASIPSKTSVGMSNLLPGKTRLFNDDAITIDGISASNRDAILKSVNEKAVVVNYSIVDQNNHEENRELFKAPLVYIYHDVIDSVGDTRKSERRTFNAVEEAISEIKKIVKKIHSAYNVSRVLITADHGFIYNDRIIAEADKEDAPAGDAVIEHNRFYVYKQQNIPALGYCIPLSSTTRFEDERWVVLPASTNRYKRQGAGHQFVHCGGTLQELIVPVIESARRREDITRKVNVKLLTSEPKIISNILRVEILQENNVSRFEKGRTVKLGIYKDYELVSGEQEIVLDSASELASERLFNINLTMTKPGLAQSALTLKIFDVEDSLNALVEKRVINNTLIQTDF